MKWRLPQPSCQVLDPIPTGPWPIFERIRQRVRTPNRGVRRVASLDRRVLEKLALHEDVASVLATGGSAVKGSLRSVWSFGRICFWGCLWGYPAFFVPFLFFFFFKGGGLKGHPKESETCRQVSRLPSHRLTWKCTVPCRKTIQPCSKRGFVHFHVSWREGITMIISVVRWGE